MKTSSILEILKKARRGQLPGLFNLRKRKFLRTVILGNELGLINEHGHETLEVDPSNVTFPVTSKYLIWERGSAYQYAQLAAGGSSAAVMPLGVSPDAPYQASDFLSIERFGATRGIQIGIASTAITIDHLVYSAASGLVGDLYTLNSTAWVIGRATKTVAAGSYNTQISFVPCLPYLLTSNGAGTYTNPTNPL